jgi:hypothetical protein
MKNLVSGWLFGMCLCGLTNDGHISTVGLIIGLCLAFGDIVIDMRSSIGHG